MVKKTKAIFALSLAFLLVSIFSSFGSANANRDDGTPVTSLKASHLIGVWDLASINNVAIPPKAKAYITESTFELRFDSARYNCYTKANWAFEGEGVVITTTSASCKGEFVGDVDRGVFKLRGDRLEFASTTYKRSWVLYKTDQKLEPTGTAIAPVMKKRGAKPKLAAIPSVSPKKSKGSFADGLLQYNKRKYKKAYDIWLPLAEEGSARAQYMVGNIYSWGEGVPANAKKAIRWYEKSAGQNYAKAEADLGKLYATGRGVAVDIDKGIKWLSAAERNGSAEASYWLGSLYEQGKGVPKDLKKAKEHYGKSVDRGFSLARRRLEMLSPKEAKAEGGEKGEIVEQRKSKPKIALPKKSSPLVPPDLKIGMNQDGLLEAGSALTLIPLTIFGLIFLIIIIGGWKMFSKANVPGIFSLIPIANLIFLVRIAGKPTWWFILLLVPLVQFVILIIVSLGIAKNFGKGSGFGIGLVFLPFIFVPILGFGRARYELYQGYS